MVGTFYNPFGCVNLKVGPIAFDVRRHKMKEKWGSCRSCLEVWVLQSITEQDFVFLKVIDLFHRVTC